MDLLQVALIFLILLLGVLLTVLGIQVFFILKDLKSSLNRLDRVLGDDHEVAIKTIESGTVKSVTGKGKKVAKRLFKKH